MSELCSSYRQATESNELLKFKFRKLHSTVVNNVNPASIINFLFQEDVIGADDMRSLLRIRDDPQQQCGELLALLHTSGNRQAFVQLYAAIKHESHLQWLVKDIDTFSDQSLTAQQQPSSRKPAAGQVVQTLPEGEIIWGVAVLAGEVYVLRPKGVDDIEMYDVISYRLQRCLTVPDAHGFADMTICNRCRRLYIVDPIAACIHALNLRGEATRWPVNDKPYGVSVTGVLNLLVACPSVRKIKEFSSRGDLLRELILPDDVVSPWHAIQLTCGRLVVCHGEADDPVHGVSVLSADGRHIVHSHGGQPGPDTGHYSVPRHLAVDDSGFVFVADVNNRRVTLLSPTLEYVRQVVSPDKLKWRPRRLWFDAESRRVYVADNEWRDGQVSAGRVVVLNV